MENKKFVDDEEVQAIVAAGETLRPAVTGMEITTPDMDEKAVDALVEITRLKKRIEERRTYYTKPMNDIIKRLNNDARTVREPLEAMEAGIKLKRRSYQDQLEAIRQADLRKAREKEAKDAAAAAAAADKGEPLPKPRKAKPIAPPVSKSTKTESGTVTYKDNWTYTVEEDDRFLNWCIENKKTELLQVDHAAVKALVKVKKDNITLPGIKIWNDKIQSVRRR